MKLPKQYDTKISDEKNNISLGQRQLILLTRAYLNNSKIIIMDNPTRHLDKVTKLKVMEALRMLSENSTTIVLSDDVELDYDQIINL